MLQANASAYNTFGYPFWREVRMLVLVSSLIPDLCGGTVGFPGTSCLESGNLSGSMISVLGRDDGPSLLGEGPSAVRGPVPPRLTACSWRGCCRPMAAASTPLPLLAEGRAICWSLRPHRCHIFVAALRASQTSVVFLVETYSAAYCLRKGTAIMPPCWKGGCSSIRQG